MKNKTYDTLKWVALVALPAFVTFFLALAPLWNIPNAQAIAATNEEIGRASCRERV